MDYNVEVLMTSAWQHLRDTGALPSFASKREDYVVQGDKHDHILFYKVCGKISQIQLHKSIASVMTHLRKMCKATKIKGCMDLFGPAMTFIQNTYHDDDKKVDQFHRALRRAGLILADVVLFQQRGDDGFRRRADVNFDRSETSKSVQTVQTPVREYDGPLYRKDGKGGRYEIDPREESGEQRQEKQEKQTSERKRVRKTKRLDTETIAREPMDYRKIQKR